MRQYEGQICHPAENEPGHDSKYCSNPKSRESGIYVIAEKWSCRGHTQCRSSTFGHPILIMNMSVCGKMQQVHTSRENEVACATCTLIPSLQPSIPLPVHMPRTTLSTGNKSSVMAVLGCNGLRCVINIILSSLSLSPGKKTRKTRMRQACAWALCSVWHNKHHKQALTMRR